MTQPPISSYASRKQTHIDWKMARRYLSIHCNIAHLFVTSGQI